MIFESKSGVHGLGEPEFVMGYCLWSMQMCYEELHRDLSVPATIRNYVQTYLKARDEFERRAKLKEHP